MITWALIPCSKSKADHPCSAWEMYWPSRQFRGAWRVAEAQGQQPLILSAKYGLLLPETVIEPYDETLKGKARLARACWADAVFRQLLDFLRTGDEVVSYLGAIYAADLVRWLRLRGSVARWAVEEPLKGKSQGARLAWFKQQLREVA